MSLMDRIRDWQDRRDGLIGPEAMAGAADRPAPVDPELASRRASLAGKVAETQFDLGGLTYEMAIRDHFRLDLLMRRAALLQALDSELGEVERLIGLADGGNGGQCRACGAPHSRGAAYCWQCGSALMDRVSV
jgi:hypothetical protein